MQTGEEPWLGTLYCLNPAVCRGGEVGCEAGESEGIEALVIGLVLAAAASNSADGPLAPQDIGWCLRLHSSNDM